MDPESAVVTQLSPPSPPTNPLSSKL
jgi:hypothetical protein